MTDLTTTLPPVLLSLLTAAAVAAISALIWPAQQLRRWRELWRKQNAD